MRAAQNSPQTRRKTQRESSHLKTRRQSVCKEKPTRVDADTRNHGACLARIEAALRVELAASKGCKGPHRPRTLPTAPHGSLFIPGKSPQSDLNTAFLPVPLEKMKREASAFSV